LTNFTGEAKTLRKITAIAESQGTWPKLR